MRTVVSPPAETTEIETSKLVTLVIERLRSIYSHHGVAVSELELLRCISANLEKWKRFYHMYKILRSNNTCLITRHISEGARKAWPEECAQKVYSEGRTLYELNKMFLDNTFYNLFLFLRMRYALQLTLKKYFSSSDLALNSFINKLLMDLKPVIQGKDWKGSGIVLLTLFVEKFKVFMLGKFLCEKGRDIFSNCFEEWICFAREKIDPKNFCLLAKTIPLFMVERKEFIDMIILEWGREWPSIVVMPGVSLYGVNAVNQSDAPSPAVPSTI